MHFNISKSEEASKAFNELESFKKFRQELKASQPIHPPKAEELEQVGSSHDIV